MDGAMKCLSGLSTAPVRRQSKAKHMKLNPEAHEDTLDRSLRGWRVAAPLPPQFEEQVWRRIARAAADEKTTAWALFQNWFQLAFARPAFAVAYALALLFLGSGTGYWRAHEKSTLLEHSLGS